MAFVEKQRHGKHDYYYLVKNVRISPLKVSKFRIFLGRKVPEHEELKKAFARLEAKIPSRFKAELLSDEVIERLEDVRSSSKAFYALENRTKLTDFLVRFTYNTNAIEGNPLTLRQTALVLADGISPQGVKTEYVIETLNSRDAWEFVKSFKYTVSEALILKCHFEVTKNTSCRLQGKYRDVEVGIFGSEWKPPKPVEVQKMMKQLIKTWKEMKKTMHPIELATIIHNKFVQIHPFTDGNGRTARLLLNYILMKNKFPPVIVEVSNKEEYYSAIEEADKSNNKPFASFLSKELLRQYSNLKR